MARAPFVSVTAPPSEASLGRALVAAATVEGVLAELPCRFHVLPEASGHWVVVAAAPPRDDGHALYVRERSLTAVQRLTLSLWSEGIDAVWEAAPFAGADLADALPVLGIDQRHVLGRIWCPDPAGTPATAAAA